MAVTIFQPSDVFATLATVPFQETAPLARALRSVLIEPEGFGILNSNDKLTLAGFTADVPGINAKPVQLALDNFLLLGSLIGQFENRLEETSQTALQVRQTLEDAVRNADRNLRNRADDVLETSLLAQILAAAEETQILEEVADEALVVPKFRDFSLKPTETNVFGSTYTPLSINGTLGSDFVSGVSLVAGERVLLSELLIGAQSGSATNYAVSIRNEFGGDAAATILDDTLNPVANGTVITAAQLSTYSIQANGTGIGALDFLSVIELRDEDSSSTFDATDTRGAYQTIAVNSSTAVETGAGDATGAEQLKTFDFFTQSGTAYTQITLEVFNTADLSSFDALTEIQNGRLLVRIGETLIDGSVNIGQVDRSQSSGGRLTVVFPFAAIEDGLAENGIDVEIRALDAGLDISGLSVRAEFP